MNSIPVHIWRSSVPQQGRRSEGAPTLKRQSDVQEHHPNAGYGWRKTTTTVLLWGF